MELQKYIKGNIIPYNKLSSRTKRSTMESIIIAERNNLKWLGIYSFDKYYRILVQCNYCQKIFNPSVSNIKKGTSCGSCASKKSSSKSLSYYHKKIESKLKKFSVINYVESNTGQNCFYYCIFECLVCNKINIRQNTDILNKKKTVCIHCLRPDIDTYIKRIIKRTSSIIQVIGISKSYENKLRTKNSAKLITIRCKLCNTIADSSVVALLRESFSTHSGHSGVNCNCKKSFSESETINYLKKLNINYKIEKTFPNLIGVGNKKIRYDFYLKDYNILLECQGIQHFKFTPFFHKTVNGYATRMANDQLKWEYANQNNYTLIEIPYWEFNNIPKFLNNTLLSLISNSI